MVGDASRRTAYIAWGAVCLIWGTTYLGIRVALETIPPALVGGIRFAIAGIVVAALLRLRGERLPRLANWPGQAVLGMLMLGLGNGGVVWAEQWVPSGIAAVVIASSPFWMTGIEALLPRGERLTMQTLLGLLIGFSGILLLVWPELTSEGEVGRRFLLGLIALQVACVGWALGSAYGKRHAREENALAAAALQMFFGGAAMLLAGTARGEWAQLTFSTRSLWAEIYLTLIGSIVGYVSYIYALKHLPVSTVSMYAYINPVIAVLLGAWLLHEPLNARVGVAALVVLLGVAVVRTKGEGSSFPLPAALRRLSAR
jgi:drug/metabolite transporter (DMT)-like permease